MIRLVRSPAAQTPRQATARDRWVEVVLLIAVMGVAAAVRAIQLGAPHDLVFDEIWSNPPIRVGKQALHDLLSTWLPRLTPGGRAVMVVGKNLGADSLQRWLVEQGYPTTRLGSAKGFRVLETRRPA